MSRSDIASLIAILIILAESAAIWKHPDSTQWDFAIHYRAARAHAAGVNPYDLVAQEPSLEYVCPPGPGNAGEHRRGSPGDLVIF